MQFSVVGAPVRKIPNPPLQCYKTTNNIYACLITKQTLQFKIRLRISSGNWDKLVIFDHNFVEQFLLTSGASLHSLLYGVFLLPDSDSYTHSYSDSDSNGWYNNVQNCFHWTYSDSFSDTDGYFTQFDIDIGTDKVVLK